MLFRSFFLCKIITICYIIYTNNASLQLYAVMDNLKKGCVHMLILSGILVMVIGLMLRFNALLVVIAAGFVTGLAAGLSINDIVGAIGEADVYKRQRSRYW